MEGGSLSCVESSSNIPIEKNLELQESPSESIFFEDFLLEEIKDENESGSEEVCILLYYNYLGGTQYISIGENKNYKFSRIQRYEKKSKRSDSSQVSTYKSKSLIYSRIYL